MIRTMMREIDALTLVAVLLGATHLGLVGLFGMDILSGAPGLRGAIYAFFGISALWQWGRQRLI